MWARTPCLLAAALVFCGCQDLTEATNITEQRPAFAVAGPVATQILPTPETVPVDAECLNTACFGDRIFYTFNHPQGFGTLSQRRSYTEAGEFFGAYARNAVGVTRFTFGATVDQITIYQAGAHYPDNTVDGAAVSFDGGATWITLDAAAFHRGQPRGATYNPSGPSIAYTDFWTSYAPGGAVSEILVRGTVDEQLDLVGVTGQGAPVPATLSLIAPAHRSVHPGGSLDITATLDGLNDCKPYRIRILVRDLSLPASERVIASEFAKVWKSKPGSVGCQ